MSTFKSTIYRQVAFRWGFRIFTSLITLVTIKIATSYFGTSNWGIYVIATAIIGLLVAVEDFGLQTIIAREISLKPQIKQSLFFGSLYLRLFLSLGAIVLASVTSYALYPNRHIIFIITLILCPMLIADAIQSTCFSLFQADKQLGKIGIVEFTAGILTLLSAILTSHWHLSLTAFALMQSGSSLIAGIIAILLLSNLRDEPLYNTKITWRYLIKTTFPFGLILLIGAGYLQIDTLLLSVFKGSTVVAWYGLSALITQFLMSGASFIMSGYLPRLATEAVSDLLKTLQKIAEFLFVFGTIAVIAGIAISKSLVVTITSVHFLGSVMPLRILIVGVFFSSQNAVYANTLVARSKEKLLIFVGLSVLGSNIAFNFIFIPIYGADGSAIAIVISELIATALTIFAFYRFFNTVFVPKNYRNVLFGAVGSMIVWFFELKLNLLPTKPILNLIILGSSICITYFVIVFYKQVFKFLHINL